MPVKSSSPAPSEEENLPHQLQNDTNSNNTNKHSSSENNDLVLHNKPSAVDDGHKSSTSNSSNENGTIPPPIVARGSSLAEHHDHHNVNTLTGTDSVSSDAVKKIRSRRTSNSSGNHNNNNNITNQQHHYQTVEISDTTQSSSTRGEKKTRTKLIRIETLAGLAGLAKAQSVPTSTKSTSHAEEDYGFYGKDPEVASKIKRLEPGSIVFPPLTYDAIKPFIPSRRIKWESVSLESSTILGYKDPGVHSEYLKFLFRDIIPLLVSLPYTGAFAYPLLTILYWEQYFITFIYVSLGIMVLCAHCDNFIHFAVPVPDMFFIHSRRVLVVITTIMFMGICSFTVFAGYSQCDKQNDYLKNWGIEPNRAPLPQRGSERYFRECLLVIHPYSIVTTAVALTHQRLSFSMNVVLLIVEILASSLGYLWPGTPVLSSAQYAVVNIIFVTAFVFAIVQIYFKEKVQQDQFKNSCLLEKNHRLAHQAAEHVDKLLCSMLPASVLSRVLLNEPIEDSAPMATVFCSDMVAFTAWSSNRSAPEVVDLLNQLCISSDKLCNQLKIEKVTTLGDAYICQSGLPNAVPDHAARIVKFAILYQQNVERIANSKTEWHSVCFRVGVHSGALTGTCFGTSQLRYEVFGETRLIAENIEKNGCPRKVLVSPVTAELLSENLALKCTPFFRPLNVDDPSLGVEQQQATLDLSTFLSAATISRVHEQESQMPLFIAKIEEDIQSLHSVMSASMTDDSDKEKEMRKKFIKERTEQKRKAERAQRKKKLVADEKKKRKKLLVSDDQQVQGDSGEMVTILQDENNKNNDNNAENAATTEDKFSSIAEIEAHFSERKYNWFLLAFENCEEDYLAFAREKMSSMVLWDRSSLLMIIFVMMICVPIEGKTFPNSTSISLLAISLVFALISTLLTAYGKFYCSGDESKKILWSYLDTAGAALVLLALPLVTVGTSYTDNTIIGTDATWLSMLLAPLVANGITNVETMYKIPYFFVTVPLPIMIIQWERTMMSADLPFLLLASLLAFFLIVLYEKLLRRQFVEQIVAKEYSKKTLAAAEDQKTLLESMVPTHVIPDLVQWMKSDMATEESIAKEQTAVVAFVKLIPSKIHYADIFADITNQNNQETFSGSSSTNLNEKNPNHHQPQHQQSSLSPYHHPHQEYFDEMQERASWLSLAHTEVDRIVNEMQQQQGFITHDQNQQYQQNSAMTATTTTTNTMTASEFSTSSGKLYEMNANAGGSNGSSLLVSKNIIVKIKVNEDQIIFAGPFLPDGQSPSQEQVQIACVEMLRLFQKLNEDTSLFTAKCGAHVGSVMAAVLGVERLAFDLFGDSLNVASRILSSTLTNTALLHEPTVCVSEEFCQQALLGRGDDGDEAIEGSSPTPTSSFSSSRLRNNFFSFDSRYEIKAKGKGDVAVTNVFFFAAS